VSVAARYADRELSLEVANETLELQVAHRSVRRFLPEEPVGDEQLTAIITAAQSASTSSNMQAWSVIAIRDPEHKARVAALAKNQPFINQAPLFLVWVADLGRARRLAERAGQPLDGADYLESTLVAFIDTALAAQNAVIAAESLGLGAVYVGAVRNHPEEMAAELGLPPHAVATFGLALGTPDPTEEAGIKPRLPQSAVLHHEQYDAASADAEIPLYDERLSTYNAQYGMGGNWSTRILTRLASAAGLHGREHLRGQLERLGLPSR
jgi:nitroreductase